MKVKTSITLSEDLLAAVDRVASGRGRRSEFIERAVRAYLSEAARQEANRRELEIINRHALRLNREALDTLAFQGDL